MAMLKVCVEGLTPVARSSSNAMSARSPCLITNSIVTGATWHIQACPSVAFLADPVCSTFASEHQLSEAQTLGESTWKVHTQAFMSAW